jgi:hypothetical protein
MSLQPSATNSLPLPAAPTQEPGEDAVRAYAYHLFQQGSGAPGHDVDDWLEATACLKANIPSHRSGTRLHQDFNAPEGGELFAVSVAARTLMT